MLKDKIAVITGANRGIGWATAMKFAQHHARVWVCARTQTQVFEQNIKELSERYSAEIHALYFDVTDTDAAKKAIKTIGGQHKRIDILVNNAGISVERFFHMTSVKMLEDTMQTNFLSQVNLAQLASRYMMRHKAGAIINVASVAGMEAEEGGLAYGSSKAAVLFATQTMALELGKYGIRVNAVSPGFIDTDMWQGRGWSYIHSLDDLQEGIMVGLLLGISLMVLRYNLALKREEAFNRLYIQVTDERNRMIDEKTRTLLFDILLLLVAGLSLLSMIFPIILNLNQFLTLTIILILALYYLLRFLLSKRY